MLRMTGWGQSRRYDAMPCRTIRRGMEKPRMAEISIHGDLLHSAEERDELTALHSITSSARAISVGGTSRPSALAVLRLMTISNFVGRSTGKSAGFAP
jgi:hypothetical protein